MRSLHLAGPEDAEKLLKLQSDFHTEIGIDSDADHRLQAIAPLLDGSPHGAIWLIGPRRAPVGYIAVTFTWSLEFGGLEGVIDELFIRPKVRKRGMGGEALSGIVKSLAEAGVRALSLEVDMTDDATQRLYRRNHFLPREGYQTMTRLL
ncbi:MAG: GNAT family N-acetyltransferase [Pelagimonas sp.]|jgi:ribosomal protein S18 acetylase RimI-like enzyme|nr:GNAT family N-acetyltransferase [Pelagimonas sp.]